MRPSRAVLAAVSGASLLGIGILARQVWRTVHRPDLPSFSNQDISGSLGNPSLPPLRIVAVGDSSLTAPGIGDLDDAWLRRIARVYTDRHCVDLRSLGVGGSLASEVLAGSLEAAADLEADIAVVSVGGNDVIRAVPARRFAASLEEIASRLEEASGAVVLVGVGDLGTIPRLPPLLRPLLSWRSAAFDRVCSAVAASHQRIIKAEARGPADAAVADDSSPFGADQFHASVVGHAMFAEAVFPAFEQAYRLVTARRPDRPGG